VIIAYACLGVLLVHAVAPRSDLRRLADVRLRHIWLVWLALAGQVVLISLLPAQSPGTSATAHVTTYALAGLFAVANHRIPGAIVVGIGGACNLAAIAANGGTMPASPRALAQSGWHATPGHFANSAAVEHPRLSWLGDIFATPSWSPVHSVFSVGDLIIVVGVAVFLHRTCRVDAPTHAAMRSPQGAHPHAGR
jgi:hypothetical protein